MNQKELEEEIKTRGQYLDVRTLEDGTVVGIGELMFTRAVYMDMDLNGWGRRFCYDDPYRALVEYANLTSNETEPKGYIARRFG